MNHLSGHLQHCCIIDLPKIHDPRGNLTFIEGQSHVPFAIERVYYLYDVPGGSERGGHAHKTLQQFIVAMSGSFDVILNDGERKQRVHLNRSYNGLFVCPMIWRELDNFSSGAVCMVLASNRYNEEDYIRDFDLYVTLQQEKTIDPFPGSSVDSCRNSI
jgi:dTDP-4-dehydrorhamnose 3,5-epimerase-like enzyme